MSPPAANAGVDTAAERATLAGLGTRWRVLASPPGDGARNMAVDAALLAHARRTGEATLRTYTWRRPTLSFGRHERTLGLYSPERLAAHGMEVVRRPTGGRVLLHHHELTYSVTAPVGGATLAESYAAINALLRHAIARLGATVVAAERASASLRPEGGACFAAPAPGELTWDGRKLAGSAQLREDGALLQHGSILLADDQTRIASLREPAAAALPSTLPAATLGEALGRSVSADEVSAALIGALGELSGTPGARDPLASLDPSQLRGDLARLEDAFRTPAWTWRR